MESSSQRTTGPTRRDFLRLTGAAGAGLAVTGVRPFAAHAEPARPSGVSLVSESKATTLWYRTPTNEDKIIEQGLPVGNGRLGALVGCDPADDFVYLTDASFWTGGANDALQDDGQFPYDVANFGTFGLLAKLRVAVPAHTGSEVTDYRRQLDLSNGVVSASYRYRGAHYHREIYASHPDDVIVVRLTQTGGGSYSGRVSLEGTHGEVTIPDSATATASFTATFGNGLRYAAVVTAASTTGSVTMQGADLSFMDCQELVIVVSAGTNYAFDPTNGFRDPTANPLTIARDTATAAAKVPGATLLTTHVADYHRLYNRMDVNLGSSSNTQRSLDTWSRIALRHNNPSQPDPELEANYLQFGRYLTITGSRDSLPLNLQGLWLHNNTPDWYSDYHTDINLQMNYWLADRAGLGPSFDALADYCVAQVPYWTAQTQRLFNDPRNRFRNSSERIAGWTITFSTNIHGGLGWMWHPAGNAWLCNSLWQHYEFTQDRAYLEKIYPILKGASEFWQSRLITTTVTDPQTGMPREVLIDDSDWSPEHGPGDAKGITYAQELVWDLFQNIRTASEVLDRDQAYAETVAGLQARLYLPQVSPTTGMLQEWMSPDDLGEKTHRHLSGLVGFFPGDRINTDTSPKELIDGVRNTLVVRGMDSYGWACAWRSLCWARLRDADKAYQLFLNVLRPSIGNGNGTAANFFDMYSQGSYTIFQIDANLGAPAAMLEMLLYSRPGVIEFLPALPDAWAAEGRVTGIGARGGFEVDVAWKAGWVTTATVRSVGGTTTELRAGSWRETITLRPYESVTVRPRGSAVTVAVDLAPAYDGATRPVLVPGKAGTVNVTVSNAGGKVTDVRVDLDVPAGWAVDGGAVRRLTQLGGGRNATLTYAVTPSSDAVGTTQPVTARVTYATEGRVGSVAATQTVLVVAQPPSGTSYLSDLAWLDASSGWQTVQRDREVGGGPLTIRGTTYAKGLGLATPGDVTYWVGGEGSRLQAVAGIDDAVDQSSPDGGTAVFEVWADGRKIYDSGLVRRGSAVPVDVPLDGVSELRLHVTDGGDGGYNDRADWADATITCG